MENSIWNSITEKQDNNNSKPNFLKNFAIWVWSILNIMPSLTPREYNFSKDGFKKDRENLAWDFENIWNDMNKAIKKVLEEQKSQVASAWGNTWKYLKNAMKKLDEEK